MRVRRLRPRADDGQLRFGLHVTAPEFVFAPAHPSKQPVAESRTGTVRDEGPPPECYGTSKFSVSASAGGLFAVASHMSQGELHVEVQDGEIIVTLPYSKYGVTYYKPANSPQLIARRISLKDDALATMTASEFLALHGGRQTRKLASSVG
jgi:hypothetical protein